MSGAATISALRDRLRQIEQPARHGVLPFGVAAIDRALPGGGLALGAVHEILGAGGDEEDAAAASGFAAGILARLGPAGDGGGDGGPVLWCLKRPDLYGPGLEAHGLDPARLVLVRAPRDDDLLWAVEEGLRAPGLAAVVGEIGRLPMVAGRRLQLAAERAGIPVLLLRRWRSGEEAEAERQRPSAAVTRWRIAALPSLDIENEPGIGRPRPHPNPPPLVAPTLPSPARGGGLGWGLAGEGMGGGGEGNGRRFGIGKPRWRTELLRVRGGAPALWDVEVADATGHVSLSAALADRSAAPAAQKSARRGADAWRRAG